MRKTFVHTSLSVVVAAALLVLLVPPALCSEADPCPMGPEHAGGSAGLDCLPGPTFDCCKGDNAPLSRGSEQLAPRKLPAAVAVAAGLAPVVPLRPFQVDVGAAGSPRPAAAEVPLYTLLATLLI